MKLFSDEDKKYMKENYLKYTNKEIAEHLGYTERQIRGWMNNNGCRKYRKINDTYFDSIDTPLKAYFLGYLFADGWIVRTKTNFEVGIQLQSQDRYILEKLNEELGGQNIIYHFDSYSHYINGRKTISKDTDCLRIYSKKIGLGLISNGVVENKTKKDVCPMVPEELFFDWLRGYIDGDGCFWKYKNHYYLHITCASEKVLEYVQFRLQNFDIKTQIYKEKDKKYRLICSNIADMKKLVENLYYKNDLFFLKRKYEKVKYYKGFAV